MGVKGLKKIIDMFANPCISEREFKDYRGKKEALDLSLIIHKFCIAIRESENFETPNGIIKGHLFALFFKVHSAYRYGIKIVGVIDGKPPEIKMNTLSDRRKVKEKALKRLAIKNISEIEKNKLKKRTFSITYTQIKEMKYLLDLMGTPYLVAPGEAEAQCAALNIAGICDGVVTEDGDALLFGCKKMLKDFSNKTKVIEIDRDKLLQCLEMTGDQLIDLGIILGTDYCNGIGNLKPIDAFKKFKMANHNMYQFLKNLNRENLSKNNNYKYKIPENFLQKWKTAKEYYLHAPVIKPSELSMIWKEPNFEKLYEYLVIEKNFNEKIIVEKIEELKLMYKFYVDNNNSLVTLSRIRKELSNNSFNNKISIKQQFYIKSKINQQKNNINYEIEIQKIKKKKYNNFNYRRKIIKNFIESLEKKQIFVQI